MTANRRSSRSSSTAPAWVPADTNDKPNLETTYTRKEFYFSLSGEAIETPGCPAVADH